MLKKKHANLNGTLFWIICLATGYKDIQKVKTVTPWTQTAQKG